jgi:hypothetical protein
MTVYVDTMRALKRYGNKGYIFSHMMADPDDGSRAELHAMADTIGVQRRWYHGPPGDPFPRDHYDIVQAKKRLALDAGAVEVTYWRGVAELLDRWNGVIRQQAVEAATVHGHDIDPDPRRMDCRGCGRVALTRSKEYGTATETGCDPVRLDGHEKPDGMDPATATLSHAGLARRLR